MRFNVDFSKDGLRFSINNQNYPTKKNNTTPEEVEGGCYIGNFRFPPKALILVIPMWIAMEYGGRAMTNRAEEFMAKQITRLPFLK